MIDMIYSVFSVSLVSGSVVMFLRPTLPLLGAFYNKTVGQCYLYRAIFAVISIYLIATYLPHNTGILVRRNIAKNFVDKHLSQIISSQENEIGIKYPGLPEISYGKLPNRVSSYFPDEDTIYLSTDEVYFLTPDTDKDSWSWHLFKGRFSVHLEHTLHHELAHYYVDKIMERLETRSSEQSDQESAIAFLSNNLMNRLIHEGIADYIQDRMWADKKKVLDLDDVKITPGFLESQVSDFYTTALRLTKPIIDKFGSRGINYLVYHSFDGKNLLNLISFQKKAMLDLENGWNIDSAIMKKSKDP